MKLDRTIAPKSKVARQFELPEITTLTLTNGLPVYFSQKAKLPIIKISLIIPGGSRFDDYGNEGLAYLTSLVWDEGAGKYSSLQLADEIDKLGSSIDVSTSPDHIYITMTSLTENFERTLELFSQIIQSPHFNKTEFEREKKKHVTKIVQSFDNPSYIAANAFQKNIFKGSPYDKPILGYSNSVDSLTKQMAKDYYNKIITNADSKLIAVGAIESDYLIDQLNFYLNKLEFRSNGKVSMVHPARNSANLYFIHKEGASQSEIVAGHLCKDRSAPDHLAAKLANSILGGQFSSRINLNLREDKGYTYGAQSALSYNQFMGYFSVSTSVQSEYTFQSIQEIQKEVINLRNDIFENEISFSKAYLVKQFPAMFETYSQLLQRLTTKVIHDLDDYYDTYIQNIWDLSKDDILAAANEYFVPEELSFFVVGNKDMIKDNIQESVGLNLIMLDKLGNPIS